MMCTIFNEAMTYGSAAEGVVGEGNTWRVMIPPNNNPNLQRLVSHECQ